MANINDAEDRELYESLFADTGSRETISLDEWKGGWPSIVGGINGIPTSRQFNTLQYITDWKILLLYRHVLELEEEIEGLKELIGTGGAVYAEGGLVYAGSISSEIESLGVLFILEGETAGSGGKARVGYPDSEMDAGDVMFLFDDYDLMEESEGGMAYVGDKNTQIPPRGVLLIVDGRGTPLFAAAGITNLEVSVVEPDVPNWGMLEDGARAQTNGESQVDGLVAGDLSVGTEPDPDATYWAETD